MKTKSTFFCLSMLAALLFLFLAPIGNAATFRSSNQSWFKQTDNIKENFYLAGGNLSVPANIQGDLVAAGGTIMVQGTTTEDVMLAGGNIELDGKVGGDARLAGANIVVTQSVAGDFLLAGGAVNVASGVKVGSDAMIAASQVVFNGEAKDRISIAGEKVVLNGTIEKDIRIKASSLKVGDQALIKGKLIYESPRKAEISENAVIKGKVDYNKIEGGKNFGAFQKLKNLPELFKVIKLAIILVSSLVMVLLFSNFSKNIADQGVSKMGRNILVGFGSLVVIPIAVFVLFASVVGSLFGFLILALYGGLIVLAQVVTGIIVGTLISGYFEEKPLVNWKWTMAGVLLVWLLSLIPVVGWFVVFILFLLSFGVLSRVFYRYIVKMEA